MIPQVIFICIVWFLLRLITFQGFIYFFNLRIACSCFAYFLLVYMVDWLMALKTYAHVLTPGTYECELPWRKGCCVGPSLLMALLLARSAWGSHLGMITSSKPLTVPQWGPSCGPCDSSHGHRIHFSKKLSVNFEEQDLLFTSPWGYRTWRCRGRRRERLRFNLRDWGPKSFPLLWPKSGVPGISWDHSLLANLKPKNRNLGMGGWQLGHPSCHLSLLPWVCWKESFMGGLVP